LKTATSNAVLETFYLQNGRPFDA